MAVLIGGRAMGLAMRVDCGGEGRRLALFTDNASRNGEVGRVELTVRAGRRAAVGVVAKLVDVEAALRISIVAGDVPCDGGRGRLGLLLEGDGAGDGGGIPTDVCDCGGEKSDGIEGQYKQWVMYPATSGGLTVRLPEKEQNQLKRARLVPGEQQRGGRGGKGG